MAGARKLATISVLAMLGALVGVTAAHAGGGGHCDPSEGDGSVIELSGACFVPSTLRADTEETITFVNRDPVAHNVSGTGWGQYEDLHEGERFTTSFADPGIYPFACTLHPGMNGVILVGEAVAGGTTAAAPSIPRSTSEPAGGTTWVVAAAIGMLVGSAAGVGAVSARRRTTATRLGNP